MAKKPTILNSRSADGSNDRGVKAGMKARGSSSAQRMALRPDVPWQWKVKNSKLSVLDLKRCRDPNAKKVRQKRAIYDAGLPVTRASTWWDAVRPLFHFACLVSLVYVLLFAACDFTAGSMAEHVKEGEHPTGHGAFCYTLRLLDFGPLNTKDLAKRALCSTFPSYAPPAP